jgi:hypothetical protein
VIVAGGSWTSSEQSLTSITGSSTVTGIMLRSGTYTQGGVLNITITGSPDVPRETSSGTCARTHAHTHTRCM